MNDSDELDKLARKVNNKNKDIYSQYRNFSDCKKEFDNQAIKIDQYLTGQYDKGTGIEPMTEGFYSTQGEYSKFKNDSELISPISDDASLESLDTKYDSKKEFSPKSYGKSIDEILSDNFDISDKFDIRKIDHEIKTKSKFNCNHKTQKKSLRHLCDDFDLHSIDSIESLESGESLLRHIRHCDSCKDKVIELIKNHKSSKLKELIKSNKTDLYEKTKNKENLNNTEKNKFNLSGSKEIIIAILVGILVIFIMDFII